MTVATTDTVHELVTAWASSRRLPCAPSAWPALWKHGADVDLAWRRDLVRVLHVPHVQSYTDRGELLGAVATDAPPVPGGLFADGAALGMLSDPSSVDVVLVVEAPTAGPWLQAATRYRIDPPPVLGVPRWRRELRHRLPGHVVVRGTQRFVEKLSRDLEGREVIEEHAWNR